MPLEPGTTLGPYSVTAKIGEGGMGEVYRARDTKLDRDVALKVLPQAFTEDPDRLARFEREAKVLASLNHPGIAGIYGLEESGDTRALVLELVEGSTLADRIAKGPFPLDEALPIAKQIAEALEAAHEAGVIHRDLKPANIKVREDGTVKVLDFGLAKALDPTPGGDPSQSPTLTAASTQMGVIMGTAAYMSPEQARGKPVDKRADIWAFGCVLFEMLTGQVAFQGEDVSLTLASVMKSDPCVTTLPPDVPGAVRTVLHRCLEKDPGERIRDIGDVRLALDGAFETPISPPAEGVAVPQLQLWQRPLPAVMAIAASVVIGGLAVWSLLGPAPSGSSSAARFSIVPPASYQLLVDATQASLALSDDGQTLVYTAIRDGERQLYRRPLAQLDAVPIPGTEGAASPFFSPDGEWIGFERDGGLSRVGVTGGPTTVFYEGPHVTNVSWGANDRIVFGPSGVNTPVMQVASTGGVAEPVTTLEEGELDHRQPWLLPGGTGLLFTVVTELQRPGTVAVKSLETGERRSLFEGSSARYVPSGHLVFARQNALWAVPFDADQLTVTGEAVPVMEGVAIGPTGYAQFAIAGNGSLAYVSGTVTEGPTGTAWSSGSLVWVDRDGREEPLPLPSGRYAAPRLSPDGTHLSVIIESGGRGALWVFEVATGAALRLTPPGSMVSPVWTPDGRHIVFGLLVDGDFDLHRVASDGGAEMERLFDSQVPDGPSGVTPDGRKVIFSRLVAPGHREVWEVPLEGERVPTPLRQGEFDRGNAEVSPDGQWLAYRSNDSGTEEIYLEPYPGPGARVPVSIEGGRSSLLSPDGSELYYRLGTSVMAVELITTGNSLRIGARREVFDGDYAVGTIERQYHVAPDGRFLMLKNEPASPGQGSQVILVQHWTEELKRLVRLP